jgi:hypothetical protein
MKTPILLVILCLILSTCSSFIIYYESEPPNQQLNNNEEIKSQNQKLVSDLKFQCDTFHLFWEVDDVDFNGVYFQVEKNCTKYFKPGPIQNAETEKLLCSKGYERFDTRKGIYCLEPCPCGLPRMSVCSCIVVTNSQ